MPDDLGESSVSTATSRRGVAAAVTSIGTARLKEDDSDLGLQPRLETGPLPRGIEQPERAAMRPGNEGREIKAEPRPA